MPSLRRASVLLATTALVTLASVAPSSAATELNGSWAPFTRCPVDDPAMLAADGRADIAICIASSSVSGSIKLGNTQVPTGRTDLQAGVLTHADGTTTVVSPAGGALVADPAQLPGGLLGLMCPGDNIPVISDLCAKITSADLNRVDATIESVNTPSEFQLLAGVVQGKPIIALPVRIKLDNPLLGSKCYIGSAADPIVLRPQNTTAPAVKTQRFDPDGTANTAGVMGQISALGATQGDATYTAPGANGCGLFGALDWAVNLKTGLPAGSGTNNVVLNNTSTYVAAFSSPSSAVPNEGALLSQYWHAGVK
ncbi:hypothetical protein G3I40_06685 [Streptomyces sp. SID14478]|uniref:hypothetical protein n=1 Tax=Streptomyces sp. SID14478 TaxID=2706073 RepID=UPI0013DC8617|nr:hypothetical protein [Streptomyces sp. SID14478]NEB74920.1 hypothetical protein [Streptomyces sp. SID14478]